MREECNAEHATLHALLLSHLSVRSNAAAVPPLALSTAVHAVDPAVERDASILDRSARLLETTFND
jgi:hypothetical protein